MKGRGIDLDESARRDQEGLHFCGIKEAVCNLFLSGKKQDELLCAEIEFAVPVVLQAVQAAVVSAAPAQFHRHPAKTVIAHHICGGEVLKQRLGRHIAGALRKRDLYKSRKNFRDGFFETGDNSAIRDKFGIMDGINRHSTVLL